MADIKISQLPEFTEDPSGSWLLLNNSNQTQTYKSRRETILTGMISGSPQIVDLGFVLTSSFTNFTNSYNTASFQGSLDGNATTSTTSQTASYVAIAQTASFVATASWANNAITASYVAIAQTASYTGIAQTASYVQIAQTASFVTGSNVYGPYGSNSIISASYALTATTAPDYLPLTGGAITGSLTISQNLTVLGTASFIYTTASQLAVSGAYISVNAINPISRFAGLLVYDSGSTPTNTSTASLLWDSVNDKWIYQNASGSTYSGGMLISGPRNSGSLGNEVGLTNRKITVAQGSDHIADSDITNVTGSYVGIAVNTQVTGSLISTQGFTGSLQGTSSWSSNAITASYVLNAVSASFTTTASYALVTITSASFASTASFVPTSHLLPLITGSLYLKDMVDVTDYSAPTITDGYQLAWNSGSQIWAPTPGAATKGVVRLFVSANRANANVFYFTSITVTADSKASPDANTAFMVTTTLLSKVNLYLRQDAAGPNIVRVDLTKNADGISFASATGSIANTSNTLTQNTVSTYTFTGLTLNQFDSLHIKVTPTSSPGQMYGIITIE